MNWKRGFKRITICIAVVTGVICAIFSIGLILYMHGDARSYLKWTQDNYIKEYNPCKLEKITVENGGKTKYKCMNIVEFRQHYPSYDDVADTYLAATLHSKYYSDLPYTEFAVAFLGITKPPEGFVLDKPKSNINFVPVSITPEEAAAELLRRRVKRADFEERIAELEKGFWVNLSKGGLTGLCILAALGGGLIGFCAVWLLYKPLEWAILGFCEDRPKNDQKQ